MSPRDVVVPPEIERALAQFGQATHRHGRREVRGAARDEATEEVAETAEHLRVTIVAALTEARNAAPPGTVCIPDHVIEALDQKCVEAIKQLLGQVRRDEAAQPIAESPV